MSILYKGAPPTEAGLYVVRLMPGNELRVAEFDNGDWQQFGIDYDCWQYGNVEYEIEVLHRLNLQALVELVAMVGGKPAPSTPVAHTPVPMVTLESAQRAISHVNGNNGRGRREEAVALLVSPEVDPTQYRVGDLTMQHVFKPAGLVNISDLQVVFNQVEKALVALAPGDGWQLVPKEPTEEMIAEACSSAPHVIITYTKPEERAGTIPLIPLATWRAMLAAAPAAVTHPPGDGKPCSTDAFLAAAVEHIDMGDRMPKFSSALDVWADGSYNEALSYLPGEVRAKLTGKG